jgi:hypothetical protein
MVLVLALVAVFTIPRVVLAHKLVLYPDNFNVPLGGTAGVSWSFTEVIFIPEYSRTLTNYVYPEMSAPVEVRYKNGGVSQLRIDLNPSTGRRGRRLTIR